MTPPVLLLLLLLTPARSSQQHLLRSQVHLPDWSQVLQLTRVSQQSWQAARLPPTLEESVVSCAASCVERSKVDGSCDSIMYVKATGECHMGTADPVEEGQAYHTVYRTRSRICKNRVRGVGYLASPSGQACCPIRKMEGVTVDQCEEECRKTNGCNFWRFEPVSKCLILGNKDGGNVYGDNFTSGSCD